MLTSLLKQCLLKKEQFKILEPYIECQQLKCEAYSVLGDINSAFIAYENVEVLVKASAVQSLLDLLIINKELKLAYEVLVKLIQH